MKRSDQKRPLPPEVLVGALHDPIHPTSGRLIKATEVSRMTTPPDTKATGPWAEAYISENGECLFIKVMVSALQNAMRMNPRDDSLAHYKVTDATAFAHDVARELNREDEDGTTRIHEMLDWGVAEAIEQGSEWVEEGARDDD